MQHAKRELWESMKAEGMECPCCKRWAKLNPYSISKAQASTFKWIVENTGPNQYVDVQEKAPRWILKSNSHGKLVHHDLLRPKANEDPSKKSSGFWGPTAFGLEWYNGNATVQKFALVFDEKCLGRRGKDVRFSDVFDPFHYRKMMATHAADL